MRARRAVRPVSPLTPGLSFGLGMISAQHDPRDGRSDSEIYADILDLCAVAENLGLDAVWLSEHHFVDDGYMPSLLPAAAAIAARTTRIAIGTGVLLAPFYDPLRLAEDSATVDLISAGRLVLGLGAGYRDEEFDGFGRVRDGLGTVMEQVVATLRAGWSDGPVPGRSQGAAAVTVTPKPHQAGGPPIWIGARSRAGIRRTARAADGLLAARVSPAELARQVALLDAEASAAGRDPAALSVAVHCPVFAWPAAPEAWRLVEPHLHYSEWKYGDMTGAPYGTRTGRAAPPPLTEATRAKIRAGALVGTPGAVADGIAAYAAAAGDHPFHFIARLYWPGMDPGLMRQALAVHAQQVIPAVRDRVGPSTLAGHWPLGPTDDRRQETDGAARDD
jgi:alkanesulfonate monooxygenase SsuD/methylene tetrahydromethanopterin reductase-like flavin-dependent oxidoreductase (luciferase family)